VLEAELPDLAAAVPLKIVVHEREGHTSAAASMHERIPAVIDIVEEISRRG
jgi:hypothetical protein